jgi:hypothetical protein
MKTIRPIDDPILSPEEMCRDSGISMATWRRQYRNELPIIQMSPRRIGVRRSDWQRYLSERTQPRRG